MSIQENSAHVVRRAATCNEAEQRVYFKNENRDCYPFFLGSGLGGDVCPKGWKLVGTSDGVREQAGCILAFEALPVCEKTTFSNDKAECCLRNDGDNLLCPPKACIAEQDSESCFSAIKTLCLDTPGNLISRPECQVWARKNNKRSDVVSAVRDFCQGKKERSPGYTTEFCSCINATEPLLCTSDDCFAKRLPELRSQSDCIAEQCRKAKPGVFVPNDKPCATVCANIIKLENVNITTEEAVEINAKCNFTPEQTDKLAKLAKVDPKVLRDLKVDGEGSGSGTIITKPGDGAGAEKPKEKTGINQEFQGVPIWGWILIAIAILITLIAIIAAVYKGAPKAKEFYQQQRSRFSTPN
jgi:hypothetical protein